jgi:hypothetical protein
VADVADDVVRDRANITERRALETLRRLGARAQSRPVRAPAEPLEDA